MFFHDSVNFEIINKFLSNHNLADESFEKRINTTNSSNQFQLSNNLFKDILLIVREINTSPDYWDTYCEISIHRYGQEFIDYLKNKSYLSNDLGIHSQFSKGDIRDLYLICVNFFMEITFFSEVDLNRNKLSDNKLFKQFKKNLDDYTKNDNFDSDYRDALINTKYSIPLELMKKLYFSEEVQAIKSLDKSLSKIDELNKQSLKAEDRLLQLKVEQEGSLEEKINKVEVLRKTLNSYETAFNFVGLYDGFNKLLQTKILESRVLLGSLVAMGFIMIIPLLCTIFGWLPDTTLEHEETISHLLKLVPFISLELLLIYFFRVILNNYKSVKAQVLQIELRQTLCQFVQNYADYSKEIKKDDPTVLEKFENLIFSGIMSDAENLPSTFDGMDQIGKLLSSLKGKG